MGPFNNSRGSRAIEEADAFPLSLIESCSLAGDKAEALELLPYDFILRIVSLLDTTYQLHHGEVYQKKNLVEEMLEVVKHGALLRIFRCFFIWQDILFDQAAQVSNRLSTESFA